MKDKKVYFEIIRVIAVLLVIFNHTSGYGLYMISSGVKQQLYMFITMITRINVPLFFMISGALLLSRQEEFSIVLKKRISRICLIIVIFTFGLYVTSIIENVNLGQDYIFSASEFVYGLVGGSITYASSYWYLYAYLGFLLMLPFLQRACREMKQNEFYMLLIVHFVISSLIPMLNLAFSHFDIAVLSISSNFSVSFATSKYLFYPIIGYYIETYIDIAKLTKKHIMCGTTIALIGIIFSCICTTYQGVTSGQYSQNYVQLFDYTSAIYVFIIIKYIVVVQLDNLKGKVEKYIVLLGSLTFGIYLLDPYWKIIFGSQYKQYIGVHFPTIIISFGWCVFSFLLGGAVTIFLKHISVLKKLL